MKIINEDLNYTLGKRVEEVLKVIQKIDYPWKFYGYKYYVQFSPVHELMTNNDKFWNSIEEGKKYLISYIQTNKLIAPGSASIQMDMKLPRVIKEVE